VPVPHHVGQAKVGDLDGQTRVQQQVLGLEVAVHDHVAVAVLDAADDLLEEAARLVLRQAALLDDVVEQLAAFSVQGFFVFWFWVFFLCCLVVWTAGLFACVYGSARHFHLSEGPAVGLEMASF